MIVYKLREGQVILIDSDSQVMITVRHLGAVSACLDVTVDEDKLIRRYQISSDQSNAVKNEDGNTVCDVYPCQASLRVHLGDILEVDNLVSIRLVERRSDYVRLGVEELRSLSIRINVL